MANTASVPQVITAVPNTTPAEEILAIMERDGAVVIQNFATSAQVEQMNRDFDKPVMETGPGSKKQGEEFELLKEFHGYQTTRVNNLITHSRVMREEILDMDLFHEIGRLLYEEESGDWWLMAAQLIQIGPGNKAQFIHRDLENYTAFVPMGKNAPRVTTNYMLALTDFTEANGATRVILGSHKWDDFTLSMEDRLDHSKTIPAEMKAGDALLWDGKLLHSGGANVTTNEFRRGVTIPVSPAYFTPEESFAFSVSLDIAKTLSPRVQKAIGFRSVFSKGGNGLWQHNFEELADHLGL